MVLMKLLYLIWSKLNKGKECKVMLLVEDHKAKVLVVEKMESLKIKIEEWVRVWMKVASIWKLKWKI